jgi:hypothetical protein
VQLLFLFLAANEQNAHQHRLAYPDNGFFCHGLLVLCLRRYVKIMEVASCNGANLEMSEKNGIFAEHCELLQKQD